MEQRVQMYLLSALYYRIGQNHQIDNDGLDSVTYLAQRDSRQAAGGRALPTAIKNIGHKTVNLKTVTIFRGAPN